jgi:hypothetical protein
MDTKKDQKLRDQLATMMRQGNAFTPLPDLLESIPYDVTGQKVEGFSHTVWELTEHLRIALHDLVEYAKDSHYASPPWPDGFWPDQPAPASEEAWQESIEQIKALTEEMICLVRNPANDLFEPFEANSEHHLLRQATIVAEHNAYHAGQIAMISKVAQRG